tara:strand:- start:852 stop:1037 length:186 start_codon:yes stop_codon:yes gene_type:complete
LAIPLGTYAAMVLLLEGERVEPTSPGGRRVAVGGVRRCGEKGDESDEANDDENNDLIIILN